MKIKSYVTGKWVEGEGDGEMLYDAITGEPIAAVTTKGIDFKSVLDYGRKVGSPALAKMTFHERGRMLKQLALYLSERKEEYYKLSYKTGATKGDSWVDIDGGIGNLFANASLRREFPDETFYVDGEMVSLSRGGNFGARHIMVPKPGVAIHINAFNFPVWGMLEKVAVNWLAGVAAVVKPASAGAFLTAAVVKDIVASGILPEGALQLIAGSAGDMLNHVCTQDVITFTGSASTGQKLKVHPRIVSESVPFNMEADSLNCSVLGTDVAVGSDDFNVFIKEVHREMTTKAGQKCTAIRRVLVPADKIAAVREALSERLAQTVIGNPANEKVRMGALISRAQLEDVKEKVAELSEFSRIVYGSLEKVEVVDADAGKGAFMSPILLENDAPFEKLGTHEIEAFGPVSTLIPYNGVAEAVQIANLGKGSLVSSVITSDENFASSYVLGVAPYHGRVLILNNEIAKVSTGHGSPMPQLIHGGPGRAGGGEEMGGIRGVLHYLQRTAVQGSPTMLTAVTKVYNPGSRQVETDIHPFKKYFEDLQIGETLVTAKHTVTDADITNFANVSGDNFYAHMDATSLEGTIFEHRVAHGYFILSKAAGLFVDAKKGPVLLNYGIDSCRFTKPVYPGTTIGVRLTVKEKTASEKRTPEDIAKGIVKWQVEIYDQTNETVGIATILTMVKMRNQD